MTKSEAEEKGKAVIAYIKTNCDRETKWAHDVLAATVRNKAAAKDVRYEAKILSKALQISISVLLMTSMQSSTWCQKNIAMTRAPKMRWKTLLNCQAFPKLIVLIF